MELCVWHTSAGPVGKLVGVRTAESRIKVQSPTFPPWMQTELSGDRQWSINDSTGTSKKRVMSGMLWVLYSCPHRQGPTIADVCDSPVLTSICLVYLQLQDSSCVGVRWWESLFFSIPQAHSGRKEDRLSCADLTDSWTATDGHGLPDPWLVTKEGKHTWQADCWKHYSRNHS